jgi:hypothetical protein
VKTQKSVMSSKIIFLVILLLGYFLLPPIIRDHINSLVEIQFCTQSLSQKLGTPNSYSAIRKYIVGSLKPGMSHDEVVKTLTGIAPITLSDKSSFDNGFSEQITIKICSNEMNNLVLIVLYSSDGKFIEASDPYVGL